MYFVAKVKSVKGDLAKKEITISFTVVMDDENMATADDLAFYCDKEQGDMDLTVIPRQASFKSVTMTSKMKDA